MLREIISTEWYTILIVISLLVLAIAKYVYSSRFNDFLLVIGNSKYLKIYSRDQKFIDHFDSLLYINLIISLSLFGFISYNTIVGTITLNLILYTKIVVGIGALILIKILLERLIGSLFEIDNLIDTYIFQKTNYKNYIGLVLLPVNIILCFAIPPSSQLIYIIIGLIFLINFIGFITSFLANQKLIINNLFYFILYLCTLEIAPYIILYKLFIN
ncbi:DUF4271 domain-containing protein [Flavobacteriaceae bacterium AU392]|nr:DUF4271 domain-containing protein [Flavobacteriaceae bacterium]RKM85080.1 DUF4271 domain-containing protein [Flavobacteriaceae bacterium AU392]